VFRCSRLVTAGDGALLRNVVTVTGTDALGGPKGQIAKGQKKTLALRIPCKTRAAILRALRAAH